MIRKLVVGAASVAVAASGLVIATAGVSGASKPTITAGPGSSLNCSITASAKLKPSLVNDWVQADHQTDPVQAVRDIPNTTYGVDGPVQVALKGTGTCTGTVTDGTNTASISGIKVALANDPANPGSTSEATCSALATGGGGGPVAEYIVTISYKSTTAKITSTTITDAVITPGAFTVTGGTITGSFAGGTSTAQGVPDATTIGAILQAPPTSTNPTPTYRQCQPTLVVKSKTKNGVTTTTATLKPPKGLKKLSMVAGSTLDISDAPPPS